MAAEASSTPATPGYPGLPRASPAKPLAPVLVEGGSRRRRWSRGPTEPDGEAGERTIGDHAGAVGHRRGRDPGPQETRHEAVAAARPDGVGDGPGQLLASCQAFAEAEATQVCESQFDAQRRPEMLLVDHAERHLPAVHGREESVSRHAAGS